MSNEADHTNNQVPEATEQIPPRPQAPPQSFQYQPYPHYPQQPAPSTASKYLSSLARGITWGTALIPAGLALFAGLVVSIILSITLTSLADLGTFTEDTGIGTDGLSSALPFIILALSLFGSSALRFSAQAEGFGGAAGHISIIGAPLLVTVVIIGVLWWLTKLSELRAPSPNRGTTWIRIGLTTIIMSLAMFLLQIIFAARFSTAIGDGVLELSFSAMTARSFFLPLLVVLVTSICGRVAGHFKGTEAIGAPFLRLTVPPLLVTLVHLAVSIAILSVAAIIVLSTVTGLPWQTVPAAFINLGFVLTTLVHFGGISVVLRGDIGDYSDGFSQALTIFSPATPGPLWFGLIVVVLAVLLAAMVSTVTRRPYWTVAGEDRQQWSRAWQVPLAFGLIWGLLSMLVIPIRASLEGDAQAAQFFNGSGIAHAGVTPLAWSFLVFILWGVAIEVLSRTVGSRLVMTFPAIAKFAAGRAIHPYWGQTLRMSEPRHALIYPDVVSDSQPRTPAEATRGSTPNSGPRNYGPPNYGPANAGPPPGVGPGQYPAQQIPDLHAPTQRAPIYATPPNSSGQYQPYPPTASVAVTQPPVGQALPLNAPAKPFDKRKATRISIIASASVLVLVAGLIVLSQVNGRTFSPEAAVKSYFAALSDGDAEKALSIADVDVPTEQRQLLTNDVLSAAKALPAEVTIDQATISGTTATVSATYDIGGSKTTDSFSLVKAGKKGLFFDDWRLQAPSLMNLNVDTSGLSTVKVNGVDVKTPPEGLSLPSFPGLYTVGLAEKNELISTEPVELRTFFAGGSGAAEEGDSEPAALAPQPTDAFRTEMNNQVKTLIDSCAKKTVAEPDGCPFGSSTATIYEATNIKWSISSYPTVTLGSDSGSEGGSFGDGQFSGSGQTTGPNGGPAWTITTETTGEAYLTGKRESFSGDTETFDDTVTFSVDGVAEIVDGKVVIDINWNGGYDY